MTVLVSVFLPTFNQSGFLPAALDGMRAQTYKDFELIVVDDCSPSDGTTEILQNAVTEGLIARAIFHGRNSGTAAGPINTASRYARGKFWSWISSDNVMHPDWLSVLVQELAFCDYGAVYSAFRRIQGGRSRDMRRPHDYRPEDLISQEECYFGPSFLINAEIWKAVGDHRDGTSHDYDHWLRVEEECERRSMTLRYVDEILCDYNAGAHQTVRRKPHLYNAPHYQREARRRRNRDAELVSCRSIKEIDLRLRAHVGRVKTLLDVGCGIRPQRIVDAAVHVGVDVYEPYIEKAREQIDVIKHDIRRGLPFSEDEFEIVWLGDIIEHLEKDEGCRLLEEARRVASRGVVVRSPVGFEAQEGDAWGLGGDEWQKHRSGWTPDEFDPEIVWTVPPGVNGSGEWFTSFTAV